MSFERITFSKKAERTRGEGYRPPFAYTQYLLLGLISRLNSILPESVSARIAAKTGELLFFLMPKRRAVAINNLNIAYGNSISGEEKRRIAKKSFAHVALSLLEFFSLSRILKKGRGRFDFSGTETLDRALARGKGVLLIVSHLGSWEYLGLLCFLRGYPGSVVGRPIRNPYIYRWVCDLRKSMNLTHIDKTSAARKTLAELKKNHIVAILIDQWAGDEGIVTDFFGTPTSSTSIPARIARRTGCALVPAYCLRLPCGRYEIQVKPEVFVTGDASGDWEKRTTDALNRQLEEQILRHPEQWTWGHRRWKKLGAGSGEEYRTAPLLGGGGK